MLNIGFLGVKFKVTGEIFVYDKMGEDCACATGASQYLKREN